MLGQGLELGTRKDVGFDDKINYKINHQTGATPSK